MITIGSPIGPSASDKSIFERRPANLGPERGPLHIENVRRRQQVGRLFDTGRAPEAGRRANVADPEAHLSRGPAEGRDAVRVGPLFVSYLRPARRRARKQLLVARRPSLVAVGGGGGVVAAFWPSRQGAQSRRFSFQPSGRSPRGAPNFNLRLRVRVWQDNCASCKQMNFIAARCRAARAPATG